MADDEQFYCPCKEDTRRSHKGPLKFSKLAPHNKGLLRTSVVRADDNREPEREGDIRPNPNLKERYAIDYSLNKKGRWRIAEKFREDAAGYLSDDTDYSSTNTKATLLESTMLPAGPKDGRYAKAYHTLTVDGNSSHRKAKKAFANTADLTRSDSNDKKGKRKPKGKGTATSDEPSPGDRAAVEEEVPDTEVIYEVFEPCKSLSLLALHHRKASRNVEFKARAAALAASAKGNLAVCKSTDDIVFAGSRDIANTTSKENLPTPPVTPVIGEEMSRLIWSPTETAYEIAAFVVDLKSAEANKEKRPIKKRTPQEIEEARPKSLITQISEEIGSAEYLKYRKQFVRKLKDYIPLSVQNQQAAQAAAAPQMLQMIPTDLSVASTDLDSASLQEKYSGKYRECFCLPRRFVIDIGDATKAAIADVHSSYGREFIASQLDARFRCVFEVDPVGISKAAPQNFVDGATSCRVWINGSFKDSVKSITLEGILDSSRNHTVDDIARSAAKFIATHPFESFNLSYYKTVAKEAKENDASDIADQTEAEAATTSTKQKSSAAGCVTETASPSEYCEICFEELADVSGLALRRCRHWFCLRCWQQYLGDRMRLGTSPLPCPDYGCTSIVDEQLTATIFPIQACDAYAKTVKARLREAKAGEQVECPNPNCDRVLRMPDHARGPAVLVDCACGTQWCSNCGRESHWPVACEDYMYYHGLLKFHGHLNDAIAKVEWVTVVKFKQCPKCWRPVEKISGCDHMVCSCGASFCWNCGRLFGGHSNDCYTGNSQGWKTAVLVDVKARVVRMSEEDYRACVQHRTALHPTNLKPVTKCLRYELRSSSGKGSHCNFYKQVRELLELVTVWLCFTKVETRRKNHIAEIISRVTFTLGQVDEACKQWSSKLDDVWLLQLLAEAKTAFLQLVRVVELTAGQIYRVRTEEATMSLLQTTAEESEQENGSTAES